MAKNNERKSDKKNYFLEMMKDLLDFFKHRGNFIIVFLLVFISASVITFFAESTGDTVVSFKIEEFEIGQIADRTIFARKSLAADELNPISIEEGEKIIRKGFPITENDYRKLKKMAESPNYIDYRSFSDKIIFLLMIAFLWFVLYSSSLTGKHIELNEVILEVVFFLIIYTVSIFGGKMAFFHNMYNLPVLIPAGFCVMIVSILFGRVSAVFFSFLSAGAVLCATQFSLVPPLFTLASSVAAVVIVRDIERRIDLVFASLILSILNVVIMVALKVIFNDTFADSLFCFLGIAFNGFISGIFALGFLTPLESILNTASTFRLMDLSDLNAPIMRHLYLQAPGTYSHSLMVATLAETACKEIGANSLLARVGAYFHDIGKMDQSEYFAENQQGENKHDDINPSLSVSVIRSHVRHGVEKARQLRLPSRIIDIIAEHHGNSEISYFFHKGQQLNPDANPEDYSYNGNPPTTKESAIVMLADTAEAACRTLENPSVPRLEKFIQTLINSKYEHGQLDNSGLTFRELAVAKKAFVQVLGAYYHSRVKYPNQKDPEADNGNENSDKNSLSEANVLSDKTLSEASHV